jgi:excisionase family DNA binding protein
MAKQVTKNPLTVTPDCAADMLGLAPSVVRQMLYKGEFPGSFKVGRRWLISVKTLEAWIEKQAAGQ